MLKINNKKITVIFCLFVFIYVMHCFSFGLDENGLVFVWTSSWSRFWMWCTIVNDHLLHKTIVNPFEQVLFCWCQQNRCHDDFAAQTRWTHWLDRPLASTSDHVSPVPNLDQIRLLNSMMSSYLSLCILPLLPKIQSNI